MYGLLLDSIQKFLCERYGEQYWERIRRRANLQNHWFVTHEVYSDDVMIDLVNAAAIELGEENGTVMRMFGEYFAKNIGHYGYARLLRVLGRDLRDFLNGLDDLHEYLRFSYPKMCSPSFFCESETEEGLILHYTTTRRGYIQYVIGQLTTVGRIYGKELEIHVLSEEVGEGDIMPTHFTMELKFDNSELLKQRQLSPMEKDFVIGADTFLGVFPFCILFDQDLIICREGIKLHEVLRDLVGHHLGDCFSIKKPLLDTLNWKLICLHANSVFELVSHTAVNRKMHPNLSDVQSESYLTPPPQLRLKGQMLALPHEEAMAFLCSPVMDSPEDLYESGIYVNDLSMHDSSRDMILAGSQKDPELKIALSQEKIRSAQLEESIQQTDRLLFQMIPKPIADQLRNGETPLNTCREFSSVSILFSDIVSFTPMCSRLHPMEVVCVLNAMCVAFDRLCETHHVYKVETIGDAYMVICGAPVSTVYHAEYITAFGLDVIQATSKINDPSTGQSLRVRVGIHSGNIVAGVVGSTVLRYDVFGDTVNVAARMEATGAPMKVHVSETTAQLLKGSPFTLEARGSVEVKGKGRMNTYWVTGKSAAAVEASPVTSPTKPRSRPERRKQAAAVPPIIRQPPSPKARSTPGRAQSLVPPSTTPTRCQSPGPKPGEWPQAEQQLQKFSLLTADAIDHSVPPGGIARGRRNTAPAAPAALMSPRRLHDTEDPPLPLAQVDSKLWQRKQLMGQPVLTLEQVCKAMQSSSNETVEEKETESAIFSPSGLSSQGDPGEPMTPLGYQNRLGPDMSMSEMNLMHMRGSISIPVYPQASSVAIQEMEQFAMQADESARNARQLAEWANNIVRQLKTGGPSPEVLTRAESPIREEEEGCGSAHQGTSVDPAPEQNGSSTGHAIQLVLPNSPLHTDSPLPNDSSLPNNCAVTNNSTNAPARPNKCPEQTGKEKCNIM